MQVQRCVKCSKHSIKCHKHRGVSNAASIVYQMQSAQRSVRCSQHIGVSDAANTGEICAGHSQWWSIFALFGCAGEHV